MDKAAQSAVCYLSFSRASPVGRYMKSRKLSQMRALLSALQISIQDVYVDEGFEPGAADKPGLRRILDQLPTREFDVFVAGSMYDLGHDFSDCVTTLRYLVEHHIRVICLDNHIDSAIDASFTYGIIDNCR